MFRFLVFILFLLGSIFTANPAVAQNSLSSHYQANPDVAVTLGTPTVTTSQISFPVTIHNDHPYLIPDISISIERSEYLTLPTAGTGSGTVVNGKTLTGTFAAFPVEKTVYPTTVSIASQQSKSITVIVPVAVGSAASDFRAFASNRGGNTLGMSMLLSVKDLAVQPAPTVSIQSIQLSSRIVASSTLPTVAITVRNSSATQQQATPIVTLYAISKEIATATAKAQAFPNISVAPQATQTFTYQLTGSVPPQNYEATVSLVNKDGTQLLPEREALFTVQGESAVIDNVTIDPIKRGLVSGSIFVTGPTVLQGAKYHMWLSTGSTPSVLVAEQSIDLPKLSSTAKEISFTLGHPHVFGTNNLVLHTEILDSKGVVLSTFSEPTAALPALTPTQLLVLILLSAIMTALLVVLLIRLRKQGLPKMRFHKLSVHVLVILTSTSLLLQSSSYARANLTSQTSPISSNLSQFVLNNTGVGVSNIAYGQTQGADTSSVVAKTDNGVMGGMAVSSIEVAPGWGKGWTFGQPKMDFTDPNQYDKVPCNTKYTGTLLNASNPANVQFPVVLDQKGWSWGDKSTLDIYNFVSGTTNNICDNYGLINMQQIDTSNNILVPLGNSTEPGVNGTATASVFEDYMLNGYWPYNTSQVHQNYNFSVPFGPLCNTDGFVTSNYPKFQLIKSTQEGNSSFHFPNYPLYTRTGYTSSCYVLAPRVQYWNPDSADRPLPLYGVPADGPYHNFYRDYAFPAVKIDIPQTQDSMPCSQDPAFPGKGNIDTTYDQGVANYLYANAGVAFPTIQPYGGNGDDNTATAYIVTEAMRSGSLRTYVAACIKPKADQSPGTIKIGFNAESHQYNFSGNDHGTDDNNGYTRKLVNHWTFTHNGDYQDSYSSNYSWGDHLTGGARSDRTCLGGDAGQTGECNNEVYTTNHVDGDNFINPSWLEANPNTTGSSGGNSWISYTQPILSTCNQFVVSSASAAYTGSSNPGVLVPQNQINPSLSATDFSSKYGRTCAEIPSISTTGGGGGGGGGENTVKPTVSLKGSANGSTVTLSTDASTLNGSNPTSLTLKKVTSDGKLIKVIEDYAPNTSGSTNVVPPSSSASDYYMSFVTNSNGSASSELVEVKPNGSLIINPPPPAVDAVAVTRFCSGD